MRSRRAGFIVVAAYGLAVAGTLVLSGHRVLPLFEGIGPAQPYHWVHPPPQFAAGNVRPASAAATVPFVGDELSAAVVNTSDAQCVVNLSPGGVPPHPGDTAVHVMVSPIDPATLGPLRPGIVPDGNAYRVQLAYETTGSPIATLAAAGNIVLIVPHRAVQLLYSPDGRTWSSLPMTQVGGPTTVGGALSRSGWYLVATVPSAIGLATRPSRVLPLALGVGAAAVLLGAAALALSRRRPS